MLFGVIKRIKNIRWWNVTWNGAVNFAPYCDGWCSRGQFEYEGCLKQCEELFDGRVLDNECYILLKNEFNKIRGVSIG